MLEGQVAALSSGYISSKDCLSLLDGLKSSALFRADQYSYILYPNKELSRFVTKNTIPKSAVEQSELLTQLLQDGNTQIIVKAIDGIHHFNGSFNNANSLKAVLETLEDSKYSELIKKESGLLLQTFEKVFNHKAFTGRSGTFFGYEGLGSIYWHMVSKLQLAVQECCLKAIRDNESEEVIGRLLEHYYEISEGIGVHKSPALYGAFPTDPYSHTPGGKGAQQPGMTGQVKEDILSRFGELGVFVEDGKLYFDPCMLRKEEFLTEPKTFNYVTTKHEQAQIELAEGELGFTYCQVPIVYQLTTHNEVEVFHGDASITKFDALSLDRELSDQVFKRFGSVDKIVVKISKDLIK